MSPFALALLIPLAAPAQTETPCQTISRPVAHPYGYKTKFKIGSVSLAFKQGETDCTFTAVDVGRCWSANPGLIHVAADGQEAWFTIPEHRSGEVQVQDGRASCITRRLVRTD
ncbi:hypothetical protein [Brevundimonas sp.]|uniref:hypothetical protein n=1 Tax=Brevundimonas sp. TaxID=1871086 RepID=UPI00289EFCB4|nr:hypothetical protein [Brevundimonas sp.]